MKQANSKRLGETVSGLATGTVGALSELVVSADLLGKGYAVFRALSPSCPSDLVVLFGKELVTVEVRTAYRNQNNGQIGYPKNHRGADLFALYVRSEKSVHYAPISDKGENFCASL
jgi:hypothetical protein